MESVTQRGYAKINLHLDIAGRTEDGYHLVETVMQSISLCDTVTVEESDGVEIFSECNVEGVPSDSRNIAVRAAIAFCERIGESFGVKIVIDKRIPMAAGMAGGSADAAAVLRGMNALRGESLSIDELCDIGASLGADVPFCIVGGSAYADGKGDVLHKFGDMPDCVILAACGGEGVSTPWAYGRLDGIYGGFYDRGVYAPKGIDGLSSAFEGGSIRDICAELYNVFELPILAERPVAARIKQIMLDGGAVGAMMSGSGPSVFGIFNSEAEACAARDKIKGVGAFAEVCRPIRACEI